jgi:hypothetical protein
MLRQLTNLLFVALVGTITGCATYIPPGAKADLQGLAPASIQEGFAAKPTSPFPASVAFVRVQAPTYTNYRLQQQGGSHGAGRYVVITVREVEEESQLEQVAKLPRIAGITGVNRMLLPARLDSDREIREAASRLQADLVFLYTFDTTLFENDLSKPLTVLTLGLSPTRKVYVNTTVSALLLDTRTGYIYSTYESSKRAETLSTSWGSADSADEARRMNEREAFAQLIGELAASWPRLLRRYDSVASR